MHWREEKRARVKRGPGQRLTCSALPGPIHPGRLVYLVSTSPVAFAFTALALSFVLALALALASSEVRRLVRGGAVIGGSGGGSLRTRSSVAPVLVAEAAIALMCMRAVSRASARYVRAACTSLKSSAEWKSAAAGHEAAVSNVVHIGLIREGSFLTTRSAARHTRRPPVHDSGHGRWTTARVRGKASLLLRTVLDEH